MNRSNILQLLALVGKILANYLPEANKLKKIDKHIRIIEMYIDKINIRGSIVL
jgi:GTP cyclohydrolase I